MSETNLSSAGNILCDFCYRKAITQLHRHRNTPIRKLLGKPPLTALVCALHIGKGLDYIRGLK